MIEKDFIPFYLEWGEERGLGMTLVIFVEECNFLLALRIVSLNKILCVINAVIN